MTLDNERPTLIVLINFLGDTGFIKGSTHDLQNIDKFIDYIAIKKVIFQII